MKLAYAGEKDEYSVIFYEFGLDKFYQWLNDEGLGVSVVKVNGHKVADKGLSWVRQRTNVCEINNTYTGIRKTDQCFEYRRFHELH